MNRRRREHYRYGSERGVILLIVLWVMIALGVLAFGFSSDVQMGARSIRNLKESATGYFLAKAAINEAVYEMYRYSQPGLDQTQVAWFRQQRVSRQPVVVALDTGKGQCWIQNEEGKFDLNAGSSLVLVRLLKNQFGLDDPTAESMVIQWTNWRKAASTSASALPGGLFSSVESMTVLPGVQPGWIYGEWRRSEKNTAEFHQGMLDLATVYTGLPQINLNYASKELLEALPGVTESLAESIVRTREQSLFTSVDDCQQRIAYEFNTDAKNVVTTAEVPIYTLVAKGQATDVSMERTVRAVVQVGTRDPLGYRFLYWKDEEL